MNTRTIMWTVAAALMPAAFASALFWGASVLVNLLIAVATGVAVEAVCAGLLGRSPAEVRRAATDGSTVVTALLVGLALPPGADPYVITIAMLCAVGLAKYLYGGLGQNPFNPAMTGYAVVLVSFPTALAVWPAGVDGTTGATALVSFFHRGGQTVADVWGPTGGFGAVGGAGFEWVGAAALAGGVLLIALKVIHWRIPVAVLTGVGVCAALGYDGGSSASHGSPLFHWFTGGTMLAAFFIATDPVTHPSHARDQWLFGVLVGALIWVCRAFASYPDGIAFAVLLANCVTPVLDRRRLQAGVHA